GQAGRTQKTGPVLGLDAVDGIVRAQFPAENPGKPAGLTGCTGCTAGTIARLPRTGAGIRTIGTGIDRPRIGRVAAGTGGIGAKRGTAVVTESCPRGVVRAAVGADALLLGGICLAVRCLLRCPFKA